MDSTKRPRVSHSCSGREGVDDDFFKSLVCAMTRFDPGGTDYGASGVGA